MDGAAVARRVFYTAACQIRLDFVGKSAAGQRPDQGRHQSPIAAGPCLDSGGALELSYGRAGRVERDPGLIYRNAGVRIDRERQVQALHELGSEGP